MKTVAYTITINKRFQDPQDPIKKGFDNFTQARMHALDLLRGKLKEGERIWGGFEETQWVEENGIVSHCITMRVLYRNRYKQERVKRYSVTIVGYPSEKWIEDPALSY